MSGRKGIILQDGESCKAFPVNYIDSAGRLDDMKDGISGYSRIVPIL